MPSNRSSLVDGPDGDVLTCIECGARGHGIGFAHKCDPIAAQKERAAIVADLRRLSDEAVEKAEAARLIGDELNESAWWCVARAHDSAADRYEKGEHHAVVK